MRFRFTAAALLLSAFAFSAPSIASAQIPDSAVPLKTVHDEINRFRAEYAEYYNAKNVAALVPMYAPDAIITTQDGSTYNGQAAIKAFLTKQAPNFPHLVITSDNLVGYGSTAIDVGSTKEHPQAGGEVTSRYLVVLRRNYGTWTIIRLAVVPVGLAKM